MLFGGKNEEQSRINDVYIIDLHTMVITIGSCTPGYWLQQLLMVWLLLFVYLATIVKSFSEVGEPLIL